MSGNASKTAHAEHQYQLTQPLTSRCQQQCGSSDRTSYLTTEAMAETLGIQAQSVRKRYSQTGSYFGLKPVKLPNRRLVWAANAVAKFLRGEGV